MAKAASNRPGDGNAPAPAEPPICGIVMPISAIDDCTAAHWADVLEVVKEAAETAGFAGRLVSASDYSGIILGEIVGNLYSDPIVVCDVSARNPNVMFELGMRLAFDKPTIIIKDDKTDYAFDTSPIEHLGYPRDLRYQTIVRFKQSLADKIKATHERAASSDYKSFLKHFGQLKAAKVETKEVSGETYIIERLNQISRHLQRLASRRSPVEHLAPGDPEGVYVEIPLRERREDVMKSISLMQQHYGEAFTPVWIDQKSIIVRLDAPQLFKQDTDIEKIARELEVQYGARVVKEADPTRWMGHMSLFNLGEWKKPA